MSTLYEEINKITRAYKGNGSIKFISEPTKQALNNHIEEMKKLKKFKKAFEDLIETGKNANLQQSIQTSRMG